MLSRRRADGHSIRCSPASSSMHGRLGNESRARHLLILLPFHEKHRWCNAPRCRRCTECFRLMPAENELAEPTLNCLTLSRLCWPGQEPNLRENRYCCRDLIVLIRSRGKVYRTCPVLFSESKVPPKCHQHKTVESLWPATQRKLLILDKFW